MPRNGQLLALSPENLSSIQKKVENLQKIKHRKLKNKQLSILNSPNRKRSPRKKNLMNRKKLFQQRLLSIKTLNTKPHNINKNTSLLSIRQSSIRLLLINQQSTKLKNQSNINNKTNQLSIKL